MNLEDEKGDNKARGIAFQAKSHIEEMKLVYDDHDDIDESFAKIIKRLNISYPRRRNSGNVSTGIPTPKRSTPTNIGNFNIGLRNLSRTRNISESNFKNK